MVQKDGAQLVFSLSLLCPFLLLFTLHPLCVFPPVAHRCEALTFTNTGIEMSPRRSAVSSPLASESVTVLYFLFSKSFALLNSKRSSESLNGDNKLCDRCGVACRITLIKTRHCKSVTVRNVVRIMFYFILV